MGWQFIDRLQAHHIAQLHALYRNEWWANARTEEEASLVLQGSSLTIGVVDEQDNLIAFTRVLTDYIFKAFIFDVIVSPDWRGKGLGDALVQQIKTNERLTRVKHFELYCKGDMIDFYTRHGFTHELGDLNLMRWTQG